MSVVSTVKFKAIVLAQYDIVLLDDKCLMFAGKVR